MKIACVTRLNNPKKIGGIESFIRNLNIIFKDYNLKIFSYENNGEMVYEVKNLVEINLKNKKFYEKIYLKLFGKKKYLKYLLKNYNPDITIINTPYDIQILKNLNTKIILVQHGSFEYYFKEVYNEKYLKLIREKIDKYIFLSKYDLEEFNKFLKLNPKKIGVIKHTCNIELRNKLKVREKKLIIISRLDKNKGIYDIIKAMKKLKEFSLKIYGDGDLEVKIELKRIIKELELSNVKLMGKISNVSKELDKESIFILNSESEGYPISCIEAMRRGLPIILRNTFSSAKDIIQGNGVLLNLKWNEDEFVKAVYSIYDDYYNYSKKSLELAKQFDIKIIKEEWKNCIEELLEMK